MTEKMRQVGKYQFTFYYWAKQSVFPNISIEWKAYVGSYVKNCIPGFILLRE